MTEQKLYWDDKFATGVEIVDNQHRYFVELINRISAHISNTQDLDYQKSLLMELVRYAEFHFLSEENVARPLNLRRFSAHCQRHQEVLIELKKHLQDLIAGSYSKDEFISFLINWFSGHTVYEDKKLFANEW